MQPANNSSFLLPEQIGPLFAGAAVKKAAMPLRHFVVYAVLGGMFIALGGLLSIIVAGGMPQLAAQNPGLVRFVAGALFPIGLVLVVVAGGGLFTSDCATLPLACWQQRMSVQQALKLGAVGYAANFIGALLVAWLLVHQSGTLNNEPWTSYATQLALKKTSASFSSVFVKGIGANLMVCLAVWMAIAAKDISGKILLLWMPVMAFVALGWEHSIANMFFIPVGMLLGAPITTEAFLLNNLLPATLGNMVGGMLLVALPYHYLWGNTQGMAAGIRTQKNTAGMQPTQTETIANDYYNHLN